MHFSTSVGVTILGTLRYRNADADTNVKAEERLGIEHCACRLSLRKQTDFPPVALRRRKIPSNINYVID